MISKQIISLINLKLSRIYLIYLKPFRHSKSENYLFNFLEYKKQHEDYASKISRGIVLIICS